MHTSKAMRKFFADRQDRITAYQLPSYSPDYNPIEYLWKNV
jgi:transposase